MPNTTMDKQPKNTDLLKDILAMLQLMKTDIKTIREDLVCMKELEKDIQKKKGEILAKDVDIPIDEEPAQEGWRLW